MAPTLIAVIALAVAGCASAQKPDGMDEHCSFAVERTVEYGGQTFKKVECRAWEFGPSRDQRERWRRDHGGEGGAK